MKFGTQFEFHKIPEWYDMYLNYEFLKNMIETHKALCKKGDMTKLPGFYSFTQKRAIVSLDVFKTDTDFEV